MRHFGLGNATAPRKPVPRGLARSGPAILSYGFRPFFLLAASYAVVAMSVWIGALTLGWEVGGSYGILNWHAHEMLFGYATAALAGYMLTAIPNWTGRLPVSGRPLLGLVVLWLAGRLAMAFPDVLGLPGSMLVDAAFLPVLATVAAIEIIAGRNWKNLRILAGLVALSLTNSFFHLAVAFDGSATDAARVAISAYVMLIIHVGGRVTPSFTHNWLAKTGAERRPAPFGRLDLASMVIGLAALVLWCILHDGPVVAVAAFIAAGVHLVRLYRWRGWDVLEEPLLLALHVAYLFVPLGLIAMGLFALDVIAEASALHVFAVGAIGNMTFVIMARASLGHTGRKITASPRIAVALLALVLAAILRPFAELAPEGYHLLLGAAGFAWLLAFGLFLTEFAPMLLTSRPRQG